MGTVKYTGPVASFHCPTNAEIRSLKVHFSPKQEGSGDPSPENVRSIVGWDGVVVHNDDGIVVPDEYQKIEYLQSTGTQYFWTNINIQDGLTVDSIQTAVTQDSYLFGGISPGGTMCFNGTWNTTVQGSYPSTYYNISGVIVYNKVHHIITTHKNGRRTVIVDGNTVSDVTSGNGITDTQDKCVCFGARKSDGTVFQFYKGNLYSLKVLKDSTLLANFVPCRRKSDNKPGMYDTVSSEFFTNQGTGEFICGPDVGETVEYEFGVLGKNKFNWDVPVSESSPTGSDPSTAREFTLDTYVIGMSVNNYYRQNYANWVLNPSVENGVISFSSGGASGYGIAFPLKLVAGQTYFLSGTGDGSVGATYYDENGELISYQNGRLNKTITVPENTVTTLIGFYASTSNTDFTFSNIQLELGSTATAYEPYDPKHTVYGGWVDLISGEVQEEWGEYIFTGDEKNIKVGSWNTGGYTDGQFYRLTYSNGADGNPFCNTTTSEETKCNILKPVASSYYDVKAGNISVLGKNDGVVYRYIVWGKSGFGDTVEDCVSKLRELYNNGTPLTVVSKLANPYINTYHLAPTQLQTFLGQNNVWSNADYVEVEYDLHETQTLLQRKAFIMANQPHIESASGAIASFKTDLRAPLKECKAYFSPKQDLHGYSNPWPAGGGRNLFHVTAQSKTSDSGVVFTVNLDGSVKAVGNPSTSTALDLGTITLTEGTYKIQGGVSNTAYINIPSKVNSYGDAATFTIATGGETITPRIYLTGGYEVNGTFYPMIKLNSDNDATWAPYENVCDINGWTEVNITHTNKMLIPNDNITNPDSGYYCSSTGHNMYSETEQAFYHSGAGVSYSAQALKSGAASKMFIAPHDMIVTYTVDYKNTGTDYGIRLYHNGRRITDIHGTSDNVWHTYSYTFNLSKNDFIRTINYGGIYWKNQRLELGSESTEYELHNSTIHSLEWTDSAGTIYGGYVDLVSGKLVRDWLINTHEVGSTDGTPGGTGTGGNTNYRFVAWNLASAHLPDNARTSQAICNIVPCSTVQGGIRFWLGGGTVYMVLPNDGQAYSVVIAYAERELNQSTYQLTPTQLKTLRGTNNIWSSADGDTQIKFFKH